MVKHRAFNADRFLDKFQGREGVLHSYMGIWGDGLQADATSLDVPAFKDFILNGDGEHKDQFMEGLYRAYDLSNERGHEDLIAACRDHNYEPDPEGNLPVECLSLKVRAENEDAFNLAYDRCALHQAERFSVFQGEAGQAIADVPAATDRLQQKLSALFKDDKNSDRVLVRQYQEPVAPEDYVEWYRVVAATIAAVLAPDGSYLLNIKEHAADGERHLYVKDLVIAHKRKWGWRFVDEFCWRKTDNGVPGGWGNRFKNAWEPVFHFCRQAEIKFRPKAVGHVSEDCFDYSPNNPKSTSGSGLLGTGARGSAAAQPGADDDEGRFTGIARPSNVVEVKSESSQGSHSAPFPRALVEFFMKAFSDPGDIVFDPFLGSGTTMAAAQVLGRSGFGVEIIFQAAEDFANVQLFIAYDYYNHLRLKPLPVTDLSGITLQFDLQVLPVNGEEGNVRPDCVKYPSVGWDKLTLTTGNGDIYEVPLMAHCSVLSGGFTPGSFQIALEDKKAEDLDAIVGGATPALTDAAYVYFMGTRWSCTSAEAIAFCNLETRLLNNIGAVDAPSCEQSIWWQDDPNFYHYLLVNGGGAGIQEAGATDAADIASRLASMVGISSYLVDCSASGNVITVRVTARYPVAPGAYT